MPNALPPNGRESEGAPTSDGILAAGLSLARDGRQVLTDVSLKVPPRCVTALLAPSGAGKSTLLRCVTRLLDPDRGTITVRGVDVRSIDPRSLRRQVGLVAQAPVMFPGSVSTNVAHGLETADDLATRVDRALEAAGLPGDGWSGREAAELSGGEQARVAIARAVVRDPEFLLLDEPTAALDDLTARQIGATLRALSAEGIGVCLATHDHAFAAEFADRLVHLDGSTESAA